MAPKIVTDRDPPPVRDVRRWREKLVADAGGTLEGLVRLVQSHHEENEQLLAKARARAAAARKRRRR